MIPSPSHRILRLGTTTRMCMYSFVLCAFVSLYTWTETSCRSLFIDQPIGVGYSFGRTTVGTSQQAAQDVWTVRISFPTSGAGVLTRSYVVHANVAPGRTLLRLSGQRLWHMDRIVGILSHPTLLGPFSRQMSSTDMVDTMGLYSRSSCN